MIVFVSRKSNNCLLFLVDLSVRLSVCLSVGLLETQTASRTRKTWPPRTYWYWNNYMYISLFVCLFFGWYDTIYFIHICIWLPYFIIGINVQLSSQSFCDSISDIHISWNFTPNFIHIYWLWLKPNPYTHLLTYASVNMYNHWNSQ